MSRLPIIDPTTATGRARELLEAVRANLGIAPNFTRILANSPKALEGFLGLYGATAGFAIDKATRERVALVVAESNGCRYCLSAHTAIGRGAGLANEEMLRNRRGTSTEAKAGAVVAFAKALNDRTGEVTAAEVDTARAAGISDGEIVEIIALVALNVFTNILNKASDVDVDFPRVEPFPRAMSVAA
jgi:uncharacterized peroxidase-related enzyme